MEGLREKWIEIKDSDALVEYVTDILDNPVDEVAREKIKLKDICLQLNVPNLAMLFDYRTIQLMDEYMFYSSNAIIGTTEDREIWRYVVKTMRPFERGMF